MGMTINSNCLLPYHLPPALLEMICHKKMELAEMEFLWKNLMLICLIQSKK